MKVLILRGDDWDGLFLNESLIDEGHTLGEGDCYMYLLNKSEEYDFKAEDVSVEYVTEEDEEYLASFGSFPLTLDKLKGKY